MAISKGFLDHAVEQAKACERTEGLPTLLVVDDEQQITESLSDQFRQDYRVVTAANAVEALAVLKQQDVSVIVSDQRMPGKTGSELLAEACLISPDTVRILLTGHADIEAVIQSVNEGKIFFYLTKPWNNKEIETIIAKAMVHNLLLRDNRRLVKELRLINADLEEKVRDRTIQLEQRTCDLEKTEKELRFKNAELERFTYSVTHDLKSPLVTISTFLTYLEADLTTQDEARIRQDLEYIRVAAYKMGMLLAELVELSQIGRVTVNPVQVSLADIIQETLQIVAGQISKRGVTVSTGKNQMILKVDRLHMITIWQNLVENAVKYMGNQAEPLIELGVEEHSGETVFFICDNGIGIDIVFQHRIFGLFDQLDANNEGSGLGLAMVKRIVELYGGRIWVESEGIGHGSCFFFTLPNALNHP